MSAKKREEIRHDWFAEKMLLLGAYFNKYRRQFIIGGVGVIALILAVIIAFHARGRAEADRWERVNEAETMLTETMYGMEFDQDSFDIAITELRAVYESKPTSGAAIYAQYQIGDAYYEIGMYSEAVEAWKILVDSPATGDSMRQLAENSLVVALERLERWDEAADIYRRRAQSADGTLAAMEWWNLARCLEHLERGAEAEEALARAAELGAGTLWAELAELPSRPLEDLPLDDELDIPQAPAPDSQPPAVPGVELPGVSGQEVPAVPGLDAPVAPDTEQDGLGIEVEDNNEADPADGVDVEIE